jgi:hypothetical protein
MNIEPAPKWPKIRSEVISFYASLPRFAKGPVKYLKNIPDIEWFSAFFIHGSLAMAAGFLAGVLEQNILNMIFGMIVLPITATLFCLCLTVFFYYTLILFYQIQLEPRKVYVVVFLSSTPFLFLHPLSGLVPLTNLIGMTMASLLLIVGLVETFELSLGRAAKLVGIVYLAFVAVWIFQKLAADGRVDEAQLQRKTLESLATEIKNQ